MKFLLDVNMPPSLIKAFEKLGHNARHVGLDGFAKASDLELIEIASSLEETIVTHDLDFGQLLAFTGASKPSVIIFRIHLINSVLFEELLNQNWELIAASVANGAIVIIETDKIRIRNLPIQ